MVAEFAFLRVTTVRDKLPGPCVWAVFRRSLDPQPELKFYLSNALRTCACYELAQLCGLRWPVETALNAHLAGLASPYGTHVSGSSPPDAPVPLVQKKRPR
jgi:hypothetical protein